MPSPRKPTATKIAEGNPGKQKLPPSEPKPKVEIPSCPSYLDSDAKKEWNRISKILKKYKLITQADRTALAIYCQEYSAFIRATVELSKEELVIPTVTGGIQKNPLAVLRNQSANTLVKYLNEFGLTPASRSKVAMLENEKEDDLNQFFQNRKKKQEANKKKKAKKNVSK